MREPRLLGAGAAGFILVVGLTTWASGCFTSLAALYFPRRTPPAGAPGAPAGWTSTAVAPNNGSPAYSVGQQGALQRVYVHMNQRLRDRVRRGHRTLALNRG